MSMLAVVSISQGPRGPSVTLMGWGADEGAARRAAFEYVNRGHNPFDEELQSGHLVEVSPRLDDLRRRASRWHDTIDGDGNLLGSECSDAHIDLLNALGRLCIKLGKLDYE